MTTQIYLIHSSDAKWVGEQRARLVGDLVPAEMREENLREFINTSNQPFKLDHILPEILSELSTIPMFGGCQVVVVHNLQDFLVPGSKARAAAAAKKGEKKTAAKTPKRLTAVETFAKFVEKDLPATENVVIFSSIVEVERGQRIDEKSKLYKLIAPPMGRVLKPSRREDDPIFLMSNALLRRDAVGCVRHFRKIYRDDARGRIFHEFLRNIRFLLQARILQRMEGKGTGKDILEMKYLPDDKRLNLYKQHPFVQKKIRSSAQNFQLRELTQAMKDLFTINKALIPSGKDLYVPDVQLLFETFIVGFCEGRGQGKP